jgi:magnesium chelatase subunit D
MLPDAEAPASPAMLAATAAACLAVAPHALGGVHLRAGSHHASQAWVAALTTLLGPTVPVRRVPAGVTDDRLLGGLDLTATLAHGRAVAERGVLADADGGVVVVPMAERASAALVSRLAQALDTGAVQVARDGIGATFDARVAVVAMDEAHEDEAPVSAALADRLAFGCWLPARWSAETAPLPDPADVAAARARFGEVEADPAHVEALVSAALAFGVPTLRAPVLAVRAARALAALDGRAVTSDDDVTVAAQLVLLPRATRMPAAPPPDEAPPEPPPPPSEAENDAGEDESVDEQRPLEDVVVDAMKAALPADLLAALLAQAGRMHGAAGESGVAQQSALRGRQVGARHGEPRGGKRLHVLETLRAAAPWQRVRGAAPRADGARGRVRVRKEDFRIRRFIERTGTTVVFAVDASGSLALNRLAEAKGAIELLLAESYARRDEVALVAFRGTSAELLLPPTRALARAKRTLAGLPGGGGTPLAHAIDAVREQAVLARRAGNAAMVVLLTDARANIARDGTPGRPKAAADALAAAAAFKATGIPALFVDTSPRGEPFAREVAAALGARYLPLPSADARTVSGAVQAMRGRG